MDNPIQRSTLFRTAKISYTTYNLEHLLWHSQAPLFARHPSLVIDMPGHGLSEKPEDSEAIYSAEGFGRAINAVLEAESISQVVLVGHSAGGYWCTMMLRLFGEDKVQGIFFCDSFFTAPTHYLTSMQREAWAESIKDDDQFFAFFEAMFTDKSSAAIREKIKSTMVYETPLYVRTGCIQTNYLSHHWGPDEVYRKTPMLHVKRNGTPNWDERSQIHFPKLKTETWDGVSHFLFMEEVEKFNERVELFLKENDLVSP